jgi:hypothetical protein
MYIDKHNTADIVKYFHNTYVKFKEEGDKIFRIKRVNPNHVLVEDCRGEEAIIDLEEGYHLDYVMPKKTVFQVGESSYFLSRIPARMWKKGMSVDNTQFQVLSSTGMWVPTSFDINTLESFVNKPCYFKLDDAIANFTGATGLQSAALTPRISISKNGSVHIDTVMVGKYSFAKKELTYKAIFREELSKVFTGKMRAVA